MRLIIVVRSRFHRMWIGVEDIVTTRLSSSKSEVTMPVGFWSE